MKMLDGKTIIVTGTARGIGHKMVELFAQNGANVFAHARMETSEHNEFCKNLSEKEKVDIIPIYFDLKKENEIKDAVKTIKNTKCPIDGLVNNAGIIHNALFQMTNMSDLREQFEVNFFAPYLFTQYISKLMIRNRKGSIVNISSSVALDGNAGKTAYGASKAALLTMTLSVAEELGPLGIRANVICPGMIETDMITIMSADIAEIQKEASFLKKLGKTDDIANTALYLLSDYSSYITGQVFRIDGGITEYAKR